MIDLISTRRALQEIPELGMEEFKTHSFLMETIEGLLQDCSFAQVRTWKTGILVYLTGSAQEKTIGW
ncbi:N-acetyldiaminopimelate deacetylase, partial [Streptococcus suis]